MNELKCKRIYELLAESDGLRILVDRLWPRGIKMENAMIDFWAKEIAPSNELRKWFSHDPEKYDEFKKLYTQELDTSEVSKKFETLCKKEMQDQNVTLLYAAKNEKYNHAVVLKEWLEKQIY